MECAKVTKISEYHRPPNLAEALALLGRSDPMTRPLGGGTHLRRRGLWPQAVVDLSALKLDGVARGENAWMIGATTTLEQLAAAESLPAVIRRAAVRQAPRNSRQRGTIGGMIATRDAGTLLVSLLAFDARLMIEPDSRLLSLQDYLQEPEESGHLITACFLPVARSCALEEISRTPADAPILAVAVGVEAAGGELRNVIAAAGGADQRVGIVPGARQLRRAEVEEEVAALGAAMAQAPWQDDVRGTAEYRLAMMPILLGRAMASLLASQEVSNAG